MSERSLAQAPVKVAIPAQPTALQRACACGQHTNGEGECERCKKKGQLQRAASGPAPKTVPPIVHQVLNSSGQPLDQSTRIAMESRLGGDFAHVRIHADGWAAQSARSVGALAYTVANHVAFDSGQYAPSTSEGRNLLAHELTHVKQQRGTRYFPGGSLPVDPSPALERAAQQPTGTAGTTAHAALSRQPAAPDPNQELLGAIQVASMAGNAFGGIRPDDPIWKRLDPLWMVGLLELLASARRAGALDALDQGVDRAQGIFARRLHIAIDAVKAKGDQPQVTRIDPGFADKLKILPQQQQQEVFRFMAGGAKAVLIAPNLRPGDPAMEDFTRPPVRRTATPATKRSVGSMSTGEKLAEAISRGHYVGEAGKRLGELVTKEAIATMVFYTTIYIASQITPAGWFADIVAGGLLLATVFMVGPEIIDVVQHLLDFAKLASNATTDKELDEAGDHFATAITKVGIDVVMAILFHKAGKAVKPYLKPPPGSLVVVDMVTPDGMRMRVPVDAIPDNTAAMSGEPSGGGSKGVGDAPGGGKSGQPKSIEKIQAQNRPWSSLEVFEALKQKIGQYRRNARIPRIDEPASKAPVQGGTVAVAKTNVPGQEGRFFGGASPEAVPEALKGKPGTTGGEVLKPANPIAENHGENVALENLRQALVEALQGEKAPDLKGRKVWVLVEQEPCSSCASGIGTDAPPGPIKQFSMMFPELEIEVQNLRASVTYILKNGVRL
jgi:hypothetical protein